MTGATIARNSVAFPNPSWRRGCTVSYGRISADGAREPVRVVITVGLVRVVTAVACLIRGFKVRKAIPSCATSGSLVRWYPYRFSLSFIGTSECKVPRRTRENREIGAGKRVILVSTAFMGTTICRFHCGSLGDQRFMSRASSQIDLSSLLIRSSKTPFGNKLI